MEVIATIDNSVGNESVGEMWKETKVFNGGQTLNEVFDWVSTLSGSVIGFYDSISNGSMNFSLYQGSVFGYASTVPLPSNNLIYQSGSFSVPMDGKNHSYTAPTNLNLKSGDYWLAFQGNSDSNMKATGYQLKGFATVHNPEPSTLFSMVIGLLLTAFCFKKNHLHIFRI